MVSNRINLSFCVGLSPTLGIRGILATDLIKKDQVIERCPALIYPKNAQIIEQTIFDTYVFDWDKKHEAMALGYGSLYNHSYTPNVAVYFDTKKKEIVFTALRDIDIGEELFINYNDDSRDPIDPAYLDFDRRQRR